MVAFPTVQLKNQLPVSDEAFIGGSPMRALTTQELLIPVTAGFDVVNCQEWLGKHSPMIGTDELLRRDHHRTHMTALRCP